MIWILRHTLLPLKLLPTYLLRGSTYRQAFINYNFHVLLHFAEIMKWHKLVFGARTKQRFSVMNLQPHRIFNNSHVWFYHVNHRLFTVKSTSNTFTNKDNLHWVVIFRLPHMTIFFLLSKLGYCPWVIIYINRCMLNKSWEHTLTDTLIYDEYIQNWTHWVTGKHSQGMSQSCFLLCVFPVKCHTHTHTQCTNVHGTLRYNSILIAVFKSIQLWPSTPNNSGSYNNYKIYCTLQVFVV